MKRKTKKKEKKRHKKKKREKRKKREKKRKEKKKQHRRKHRRKRSTSAGSRDRSLSASDEGAELGLHGSTPYSSSLSTTEIARIW